jgi:hypothetical protein
MDTGDHEAESAKHHKKWTLKHPRLAVTLDDM